MFVSVVNLLLLLLNLSYVCFRFALLITVYSLQFDDKILKKKESLLRRRKRSEVMEKMRYIELSFISIKL